MSNLYTFWKHTRDKLEWNSWDNILDEDGDKYWYFSKLSSFDDLKIIIPTPIRRIRAGRSWSSKDKGVNHWHTYLSGHGSKTNSLRVVRRTSDIVA